MPRKKHYEVALITPDSLKAKGKRVIRCLTASCGLKYSVKDYAILYPAKKLMYFEASSILIKSRSIICHQCLRKHVLALSGAKVARVLIVNPDTSTGKICHFYPSDRDE